MRDFIKGFIEKEHRDFKSTEEAVLFLFEWINKLANTLNEIYKNEKEASVKEHLIIKNTVECICEKLETYGVKISYDELSKQVRDETEKNWPRIKKEIAEILEAREKSIEDLMNRIKENDNDNPNV